MKNCYKKGISLIVLVITIIVIAILAGTIIVLLFNNNTLDQSKKAKFMSDYRTVQEGVNLFSLSKYNSETNEFELPLKGYLTAEDKTYIADNVPTLKTKIEELSGAIDTVNLAWISSEDIGVRLSSNKAEKGYILDVASGLIYDYNGDYFEGQMWHTLDGGVIGGGQSKPPVTEELWNGWIKLTLYYPPNSTEKQWRLGTEGELRVDPMLMWQNYTGPITIPLDRVKDVWIKYKIDNKEVVIPPAGTLLVDIVPDKTGYTKVPGVKVHINFDETAIVKEYRIGDSSWMPYTGEFNVTENCIIEARAKKTETIYNVDGTVLTTRNIAGRDLVYIGNIGTEETELDAPTITRLPAVGTEKARLQVTYPANADKKIYKVNYGIEENYTTEISVQNYGTYIIAYYYDASGKRSQAAGILINDTSTGTPPQPPGPYDPKPPYNPGDPQPPVIVQSTIPAPTVVVSPTAIAEEVQVSITAPANADKVYIKLGRYGDYQLYTTPLVVRENMDIYAYYRTYMGERSDTGYGRVSNIKKNNRPYVRIDADPYPYSSSYGASEVNITINYSDASKIEYSEDGVVFIPYTAPFKVTENKTIYARGTNSYGITETSLNITNIGKIKSPTPMGNLSVGINVNPEPTVSTTRYLKASISIEYDEKSTEKYYRIGTYGELKPYTGAFEVTSNCTIYAYAKGTNATGSTSKRVDNLSSGIAEPLIYTAPGNSQQTSKVSVTIDYDKYSKIKRYSIDGGALRDYGGAFEVTKNGSVVYAYSENDVGQKAESRYTINNIISDPPVLLLDKGQYYLLKLNYPPNSKNQEYKWKANGAWTGYKQAGILLLKPQYKDQLIQNGTLVKIEDENGNLVTFTGDYYFIDVPISDLFENLFMRWDREPLGAPQIVITPAEPSMQVSANIVYSSNLVKKLYKVVNPDGSIRTDWTDYTGPITIDRNNSIVYAKGMDDTEVWTVEGMKKVINIDENPPIITLTADLTAAQQKVAVRVAVTDDVGVGKVKWSSGIQGESYFTNSGTEIQNNGIVNITNNGYYTFYAEDQVGNTQVYTLNITNVDLTAPAIDIQVIPETTVGLNANVTINYGDSVTKQYKIGTSNATWTNYTAPFAISSYTVLSNNWQNTDGTVTIYAKGKDSAGNEITVQKKVVSLDLDKPKSPIINSNAGYPILYEYGINLDTKTTIVYDTRTDINNYYSLDNGVTWLTYTGEFNVTSGTIIAKSVKKSSGLETVTSVTISMPSDAITPLAYDGNDTTKTPDNSINKYIKVDNSLGGKKVRIKVYAGWYPRVKCLNESGSVLSSTDINGYPAHDSDIIISVPVGTNKIIFTNELHASSYVYPYEFQVSNEPGFTATNGYMLITADPTKMIKIPYQMVSISYFSTSVQRLYRIGTTGTWMDYNDQPIKVTQGDTIYAKGVDQYGNETRIIPSYTSNVTNAITSLALDGNETTRTADNAVNKYINIDSTLGGKKLRVKVYAGWAPRIKCLDAAGTILFSQDISAPSAIDVDFMITVPVGTNRITFTNELNGSSYIYPYEFQVSNEPTFTATNGYMLLSPDPTKVIKTPYQMVSISYFSTSVQKLYRIGTTGTWIEYNDQPIKVTQGETVYAKGIDQYGIQTRIIASYTSNVTNAITFLALDGNDTTRTADNAVNKYINIDSTLGGKKVRVKVYAGWAPRIKCLDAAGTTLFTRDISAPSAIDVDFTITIPVGTNRITFTNELHASSYVYPYEFQVVNEPEFTATNGYMLIHTDNTKAIRNPYQMVNISYFFTSVQRLYRIGTTGDWLSYNDKPLKVDIGLTIYAKGIDQYGNETRITSTYTSSVSDALGAAGYDGNTDTYTKPAAGVLVELDSSLYGKQINIKHYQENSARQFGIKFLNSSRGELQSITGPVSGGIANLITTVPNNSKYILFTSSYTGEFTNAYNRVYEITVAQ